MTHNAKVHYWAPSHISEVEGQLYIHCISLDIPSHLYLWFTVPNASDYKLTVYIHITPMAKIF